MLDSRQTQRGPPKVCFTFYPLSPSYDSERNDFNATGKAGYAALASRLTTRFFGPEVLGATTQAYIEFDFTSVLSSTSGVPPASGIYAIRLEEKPVFWWGQSWHPLSANLTPTIIGLNTGAPFWAFNRSPQIRLEHRTGKFLLTLAHVYQADFASPGPLAAVKSSEYQRNFPPARDDGIDTVRENRFSDRTGRRDQDHQNPEISPQEPENLKYKTSETLTTFAGQAWVSYTKDKFQFKGESMYGQNMYESFHVRRVRHPFNRSADRQRKPIRPPNIFLTGSTLPTAPKWRVGPVLPDTLKNLGTTKTVPAGTAGFFGREFGMEKMTRVSPHILYTKNNFSMGKLRQRYRPPGLEMCAQETKGEIANAPLRGPIPVFQLTMSYNFLATSLLGDSEKVLHWWFIYKTTYGKSGNPRTHPTLISEEMKMALIGNSKNGPRSCPFWALSASGSWSFISICISFIPIPELHGMGGPRGHYLCVSCLRCISFPP